MDMLLPNLILLEYYVNYWILLLYLKQFLVLKAH